MVSNRTLTFQFATIGGVEPVDPKQLDPPIPPWLDTALFAPDGGEYGQAIALLDGASIFGLPEMLEISKAERTCLYRGEAAEELADVAPWLVGLNWKDGLTRNLFTAGDAPWQLFDSTGYLLFRTADTLDGLGSRLRRLTKIRRQDGASFFLRFWEGLTLFSLLEGDDVGRYRGAFMPGERVASPYRTASGFSFVQGDFHAHA